MEALRARALANVGRAFVPEPEPVHLQTVSMEAAVSLVRSVLPVSETWVETDPLEA